MQNPDLVLEYNEKELEKLHVNTDNMIHKPRGRIQ